MLELRDVDKEYRGGGARVTALERISLRIEPGELLAIVGPSGSGKSTLMHILGLLDRPDRGRYLFEGRDVSDLAPSGRARLRRHHVGFVFQAFNLLPRYRAVENVELPLVYAGVPAPERRQRAVATLQGVGLADRGHHWPQQLSGGEQQRVAIARAIVGEPSLILADEPTGSLDTHTGLEVLAALQRLNRSGSTVVVVTHEAVVARHARRVVALRDGAIVSDRAVAEPLDAARALRAGDGSARGVAPASS